MKENKIKGSPVGGINLKGKADRVDATPEGSVAVIDYAIFDHFDLQGTIDKVLHSSYNFV